MNIIRCFRIVAVAILLLLLTGCWSSHDISDQHYVTGMGLDYDGEKFIIYAQIVNFESIASTATQGGDPENLTYIGRGSGDTVHTAAANLYASSQVRVDWGHSQAVVVTHRAMQQLGSEIVERIYRFPENRYNTWLYVTRDPVDEVLSITSFYNRTSLYSILHMPNNSRRQLATLPPVQMFKYLSVINEPDRITYVPCIGFDSTHWKSEEKPMKLLEINGGYIETHDGTKAMFDLQQLKGYRWIDPKMTRTLLPIKDEKTTYAVLTFHHSKVKKKAIIKDGKVKFTIKGFYKGTMNEYIQELDYKNMMELAKKEIYSEIMEVYQLGIENQIDLFNLMHTFRMKYPDKWREMTKDGTKFILDDESIEGIEIDIHIPYNGKYKRQK